MKTSRRSNSQPVSGTLDNLFVLINIYNFQVLDSISIEERKLTKEGFLWQQRDKVFSRWKERFFILNKEYLLSFRKPSADTTLKNKIFKVINRFTLNFEHAFHFRYLSLKSYLCPSWTGRVSKPWWWSPNTRAQFSYGLAKASKSGTTCCRRIRKMFSAIPKILSLKMRENWTWMLRKTIVSWTINMFLFQKGSKSLLYTKLF